LAIAREIGDRRSEGNALANMGLALKGEDPKRARTCLSKALSIYSVIEDPNATRVATWIAELDHDAGGQKEE
jgi:hypothetical protein